MATYIPNTTSNRPTLSDPNAVREVLKHWDFVPGPHGNLTVEVQQSSNDDEHVLVMYGEAEFEPYPTEPVDHPDEAYEYVTRYEFGEAIAPYLEEDLVVQTIGREKLRYPFHQAMLTVNATHQDVQHVTSYDVRRALLDANIDSAEAVLGIPTEEDVAMVLDMLQYAYDNVADEYERAEPDEMDEIVARQGSLVQELFAQLSNQGYSHTSENMEDE